MTNHLRSGILYTALGKYSNVIIQLLVNIVLSRLLSPHDYGVVAVAQVFLLFFTTLVDAGLGPALIQNKSLTEHDNRVLFRYSILFSLLLSLAFMLLGPGIARFYDDGTYIPLSISMASTLFFQGINMVPNALMNKDKRFKEVNMRLVFSNLCGGLAGICGALAGWGVYALVLSFTVPAIFAFVMNMLLLRIAPARRFDRSSLSKVWNFAKHQFGFNFINYFSRNVDKILVGKMMGPTALGNYSKSYQLLLMPNQVLLEVINPVLLPVLSDYQDDIVYIRTVYFKIVHLLLLIGFPLSVFMSWESGDIIRVLFGNQWGGAVLPFSILALTVWIQMSLSSTGAIFQALGQTGYLFWNGCITAIVMVSGIVIGCLMGSITSLALTLSVSFLINFIIIFFLMIYRLLESTVLDFAHECIVKPLGAGLLLAATLVLVRVLIPPMPPLVRLLLTALTSVLVLLPYTAITGELSLLKSLFFRYSKGAR
ncbi:lipopolysaccharide biosynthesis protein [Bifidobacterium aemilianum]|uniref:Lipopolysaccharide biosynthesis protein n=1 Tax=Bifidobacterium aemilianum TaxID=2493120 RepID=A0A366KBK7_9BIFI|nr:lipopolysaccharide biosynthesis protein [Bifidobacterium aemilianum]RBP98503.1 lipopolysaccharide biosynthesis protein [Bifidobacterium aemilianum]